jgi:hypothetical protein
MRNPHPAALEALNSAVEHAKQTSRRIERAQQREEGTARLIAKSLEHLRRSRARLAALASRAPSEDFPPAP